MITITFPTWYVPALVFWLSLIFTGFNTLSEPIANVIKRKAQTRSDVMACVTVGLLFMVVGGLGALVTWPHENV